MTQSKTQTIQAIYGAFARGDIPSAVQAFVPQGEISFNVVAPSWSSPDRVDSQTMPLLFRS